MCTDVGQALYVLPLLRQYDGLVQVFLQYPAWVNILRSIKQPSLITNKLPTAAKDLLLGSFPSGGILVEVRRECFGFIEVGIDFVHGKN